MSDSDHFKLSNPKLDLISSHCPKIDIVPDFDDGSQQKQCMGCDTPVFNLSALSEIEAQEFLNTTDNICIRYAVNEADEPLFQRNERTLSRSAALAGGLTLALGMTAACGVQTDHSKSPAQVSPTKPTTAEQQPSSVIKRQKVGTKAPHWVGKVAHPYSKAVQRQLQYTKEKYEAGIITKQEYSDTIATIKTKSRDSD
jgi:hypothetical protein